MEFEELRTQLRTKVLQCFNGDRTAVDIHHLNSDHADNAPENLVPICKICHNKVHNITPQIDELGALIRNYWAIQKYKFAFDNQMRAYKDISYPTENFELISKQIGEQLKIIKKIVKKEVKVHEMYEEGMRVKGLGPIFIAGLVSIIKDPTRFANPSKVWKFFGLHTEDGRAVKRKRGVQLDFALQNRTFMWKIGDSINKNRNRSRLGGLLIKWHDFYKAKEYPEGYFKGSYNGYKKGDIKLSKGHALNRAKRKVEKILLTCFWAKWCEIRGIVPRSPYAIEKGGHTHVYKWEDIADEKS